MTDQKGMTITYKAKNGIYVNMTNRCPCACTFCLRQNAPGVYGSDPLWLEREPTVEDIAQMSPMCSTMVARDRGTTVSTADQRAPLSTGPAKRWNTLFFQKIGRPNHLALLTAAATEARSAGSTMSAKI